MKSRSMRGLTLLAAAAVAVTGAVTAPLTAVAAEPGVASHRITWTGEAASSFGASAGRNSCDVTGDGIDDVIVGSRDWKNQQGIKVGAAYVLVGGAEANGGDVTDPAAAGAIRIDGIQDWSGWSVSCLGDVNGDGVADFALGSGSRTFHQVAVVFGGRNLASMRIDQMGDRGFIIEDSMANDKTTGDGATDNFGYWVGSAGDFNGDGYDDIAIGDLLADNNGLTNSGSVWVVSGAASAAGVDVQTNPGRVLARVDGQNAQDRLATVESAGDVNGDGKGDLLLGSYVATPWGASSPAAGAGYIVFGGNAGNLKLSGDLGDRGYVIAGATRARDRLGISAAALGDVNGDGIADVIVGGDGVSNATTGTRNGGAAVVFGSRTGNAAVMTDPDATDFTVYSCQNGALDAACAGSSKISRGYYINGAAANAGAGFSVSGVGDVNGDGVPDAAISSDGTASAYLVYGDKNRTATLQLADLTAAQGERYDQAAGRAVSEAGDFDGNGTRDFLYASSGAVTMVLRGALKTAVAADLPAAAVVGDDFEVPVDVSALVRSAQGQLDGTLQLSVNGEAVAGAQAVAIGDGSVVLAVPATRAGALEVTVGFTPSDANAFAPASTTGTVQVARRDDGAGTLRLDGRLVEFGDTVEAEFGTAATLTGDVEFRAGERVLATAQLNAGSATARLSGLAAGKYDIVAHFMGDENTLPFASKPVSLRVAKLATEVPAPELSATRTVYGTRAVTARVQLPAGSGGTVTFYDNGRQLQRVATDAAGVAAVTIARPAAGVHDITAKFNGSDTGAASAVSEERRLTVTKSAPKSISVSTSKFTKKTRPTITVRVGKLADGSAAVGTVTVRVGAHRVSVPLKASAKGVVKVKLGKKYGSSIRVRASFASNDAGNVSGKTSKTVTVRAKR